MTAYNRVYRQNNRDKIKSSRLKYSFNIDLDQYNELFTKQNGCCAICEKHQTEFNKALAVDHDYDTNKIRGLLCANCNKGIGNLQESVKNLNKAIDYLSKNVYTGLKIA